MNILSIETATDWCGIALFINGDCKQKIQKKIPKKHSEQLPVYYNELLLNSSFNTLSDLTEFPGGFLGH